MSTPASPRTLGVEEEFLLFRRDAAVLEPVGDAVAAQATEQSAGSFEHELKQPQAELSTLPTTELGDVSAQLHARRTALGRAAADHGARLVAMSTSPVEIDAGTTAETRYHRMEGHFGEVARHQVICGMHVHVGVDSDEERVGVVDRLQPWLPVLLALSGNSPLWRSSDTAYDSYRSVLWGQWPTSGPTAPFGDLAGYRRITASLVRSGASLDEAMVYYPARLSPRYPTVEVRVADVCASVEDAVTLAGLVRALVHTAAEEWAEGAPLPATWPGLLHAAHWRAARFGVRERLLDPSGDEPLPAWTVVETLLERVRPALQAAGDLSRVEQGLELIRGRGTGAALQRAALAEGSLATVVDVVAEATLAR
ncbi:YbdK family carboxylate-amine ligase [Auraticoccus sp. F435]|uniref:Putative glutamate--cysteine ligase 2 n=1 Tax=Auraticoccus cholistanensis TaxID=2656650 RepID=A0A6A9V0U3_9ACTN|nr:glutamate--cysteine ligase [Auraticoccus cholistanensis]MVA76249.1 YbdK family carboxylate-amine ligase [Auraticoccus cholistanensis]